jgi:hypothetical protein
LSTVYANVRVQVWHRPPGCMYFYRIPSSLLRDPRIDGRDWIRLKELRIDVYGDRQGMVGVATNAAELRDLLDKMVGKKPVKVPYTVAKRIEEGSGPTPSLRRSIHYDEKSGEETKDPAILHGPTAAKPLFVEGEARG